MKVGSLRGIGLLVVPLLLGCGSDDEKRERSEYRDEGKACVWIGDDNRLAVQVVFPACLSSSCDRELRAECTVSVNDGKVSITSYALSETTGASECTLDCGTMTASCHGEGEVDAGSYDIQHGAEATTAELSGAQVCLGDERF
jgi:hypothetical protein